MKKRIYAAVLSMLLLSLTACGNSQSGSGTETTSDTDTTRTEQVKDAVSSQSSDQGDSAGENALIAYFAYSENMGDTSNMSVDAIASASLNASTANEMGNLQVMADVIKEQKGADVFHIVVEEPYNPDYETMLNRAIEEMQNEERPALQEQIEDLEQYDVVYIGVPVWNGSLPMPMVTFFEEHDFTGKTIVPFGIHLGSRFGSMISQMEELEPDAVVLDGYTVSASTDNEEVKNEFAAWLEELQLD